MDKTHTDDPNGQTHEDPPLRWSEILLMALDGLYPSIEQLEAMIDRMERTP